jgi:hypothetical protein
MAMLNRKKSIIHQNCDITTILQQLNIIFKHTKIDIKNLNDLIVQTMVLSSQFNYLNGRQKKQLTFDSINSFLFKLWYYRLNLII